MLDKTQDSISGARGRDCCAYGKRGERLIDGLVNDARCGGCKEVGRTRECVIDSAGSRATDSDRSNQTVGRRAQCGEGINAERRAQPAAL